MRLSKSLASTVREAAGESGLTELQSQSVARFCALGVAAMATIALLGWVIDVETLRSILHGRTAMNPLSEIGFVLAALSLWVAISTPPGKGWSVRPTAQGLALGIIFVGAQRELVYALGWEKSLDQLLFTARLAGNPIAPNTAIN